MSLRSFVRRLGRRTKKLVRKVAPIGIPIALSFALGPAGAGIGARLAGGFAKIATAGKTALGALGGALPTGPPGIPGATPPINPTPLRAARQLIPTAARLQGRVMGLPNARTIRQTSPEQVQALPFGGTPGFHQAQAAPPIRQGIAQMSLINPATVGGLLGRILPALGRAGRTAVPIIRRNLPAIGAGVATSIALDQFGNPVRKRRRMNPYNPKAARRAIRRIRALRREMQKIERMLPKQKASRPRVRHEPTGYRHTRR